MRERGFCAWRTISGYLAVRAALVLSAAASCTTPPRTQPAAPRAAPRADTPPAPDERRMYIDIQPGQLGFDHSLQARPSRTGVPHELHDGDTVTAGDRISVLVLTSVDAYLYLAFCSRQGITLYPSQGGIRAQAGVLMAVPLGTELIVDDEPGPEVLYVVASTTDISVTDPRLAAALATKKPSNTVQDCGPALDASLGSPPRDTPAAAPPKPRGPVAPMPKVLRGHSVAKRPLPSSVEPHSPSPPHTGESTKLPSPAPSPPPDPDFVRHPGNIVWYHDEDTRGPAGTSRVGDTWLVTAADSTGIAVVRHVFIHVE